jgi:hypothetical protein
MRMRLGWRSLVTAARIVVVVDVEVDVVVEGTMLLEVDVEVEVFVVVGVVVSQLMGTHGSGGGWGQRLPAGRPCALASGSWRVWKTSMRPVPRLGLKPSSLT